MELQAMYRMLDKMKYEKDWKDKLNFEIKSKKSFGIDSLDK